MTFTKTFVFGFLAILSSHCFITSEACDCIPIELQPKNVGCRGDFLAVVTITGSILKDEIYLNLPYKLIRDGTPRLAARQSLSSFPYLTTAENSAMCGVYLEVNKTYLVKGKLTNEAQLHSCHSYIKKLGKIPTEDESEILFGDLIKQFC